MQWRNTHWTRLDKCQGPAAISLIQSWRKLQINYKSYKNDVGVDFSSEICSFRREFKDELKSQSSVLDVFKLLLSFHMAASVPELTVCALFLTLPVTVASAQRSFSKLKLIKTYLRSTMAQDRLDGLSLLAIERDAAQKLDIDSIIASCKH